MERELAGSELPIAFIATTIKVKAVPIGTTSVREYNSVIVSVVVEPSTNVDNVKEPILVETL